jgi:peptidyl-prolyl cis-trans isomerase A (cyclophilin A)/peptidyl-prolyl cis-trans isomerase B (cyclophilin B)
MRRVIAGIKSLVRSRPAARLAPCRPTRLEVEALEDRSLLSGTVTGFAFIDGNNSGVFNSSEAVKGITITLSGTASTGKAIPTVTAVTDGSGMFSFANVPTGNFQLSAQSPSGLMGQLSLGDLSLSGGILIAGLSTNSSGQTNQDNGGAGLMPQIIGGQFFLNTSAGFSFAAAGSGSNNSIDNPFLTAAFATELFGGSGGTNTLDLAGHIADSGFVNGTELQFTVSAGGQTGTLFLTLNDQTSPANVTNFLDYVEAGDFDSSIFQRLNKSPIPFVLQGGSFKVDSTGKIISNIENLGTVPGEASASNVAGTIALALSGTDANSGSNGFFFNLGNNTQLNSGPAFTVFGHIGGVSDPTGTISQATLNLLMSGTPTDMSAATFPAGVNPAAFGPVQGDKSGIPLFNYAGSPATFPGDANLSNYDVITSVSIVPGTQNEALKYTATSSDSTIVSVAPPVGQGDHLKLTNSLTNFGVVTITVTATDLLGNTFTTSFKVDNIGVTSPDPPITVTSTLTAAGVDPTATVNFQWLKTPAGSTTASPISGQTNSTLNLGSIGANTGDQYSVQVTPIINGVAGTPITSAPVSVP